MGFHPKYDVIPVHIGIIPDGGRRYAKKMGMSLFDSYILSMEKLGEFCDFFFSKGVEEVSIYFSSKQNFKRIDEEVACFETAEYTFIKNQIPELRQKYKELKVNYLGDIEMLSKDFQNEIEVNATAGSSDSIHRINLCVAYDPIDEIKYVIENYDPDLDIQEQLWCKTPLDLIVRSGGANLLSNFMLIQSGFARLYCEDKLFNELSLLDMKRIIDDFGTINRKYGE